MENKEEMLEVEIDDDLYKLLVEVVGTDDKDAISKYVEEALERYLDFLERKND